jgi:outer membrane protein OmpA-like peptidoglycan-associated protein
MQIKPTQINWRVSTAAMLAMLLLASCADKYKPAAPVASNPPLVAPGPNATWYRVSFGTNSHTIDSAGQAIVNQVVVALDHDPAATATIIGKTDSVGSADYNMHLSHLRADAVRDALVYGGKVPADHVETRWTGERRPDVATASDVADAANRVVDIAIH